MLKKINVFTIVEIVLAMLLSSIVIFLAYRFYADMERYVMKSISDKNRNSELLFRTVLKKDIMEASRIMSIDSGMVMVNDTMRIKYLFEDSSIQRIANSRDTFLFTVVDRKFWNDTLIILENNKVINRIDLTLMIDNRELNILERRLSASVEYF
jgi:hypothetical protein